MKLNVAIPREQKEEFLKDFLELLSKLIEAKRNEFQKEFKNFSMESLQDSRETRQFEKNLKEISSKKYLSRVLRWAFTFEDFFKEIDKVLSKGIPLRCYSIVDNLLKFADGYAFLLKFGVAKNFEDCISALYLKKEFVQNENLFNELLEKNLISKDDVQTLLRNTSKSTTLCCSFFKNTNFVQYTVNNILFDQEIVDNFNTRIEEFHEDDEESHIENVFDELRIHVKSLQDKQLNKQIDLNENLYLLSHFDLSNEDQFEIAQQIVDNDQAQKRLKELAEHNLESTFDDSNELLKYLKKSQKKYSLNI